jgi:hypothetical protein
MRFISNILVFLLSVSTALSLNNNNPETWHSPNKKYAVKESFYGEGKRVIVIFVNLSTGRSVVIDGSGARNSTALWSPDSHYVAINFERSHNWGDTAVYRVEKGRVSEIKLPSGMEATRFLPSPEKDQILHVGPQAIRAIRWLDTNRMELVAETAGAGPLPAGAQTRRRGVGGVERHFIVKISRGSAEIVKSYGKERC